jgi:uncharacterized protein YxeA
VGSARFFPGNGKRNSRIIITITITIIIMYYYYYDYDYDYDYYYLQQEWLKRLLESQKEQVYYSYFD